MTAKAPKTLVDVPQCVLVEQVYGRLSIQDRKSLSITCKRLRKVALDGAVFSETGRWASIGVDTEHDGEHINERTNDESFQTAQLFRTKCLELSNATHAQLFLERYAKLSPEERWHIRAFKVTSYPHHGPQTLTTPLGTILPTLQCLSLHAANDAEWDTRQVFTDLTNCTELYLHIPMQVHADIFSSMPRLRSLKLSVAGIANIPRSPTVPTFNSLQHLTVLDPAGAQELLEQLGPHLPHLRSLIVINSQLDTIPPGAFGLLRLESLKLLYCRGLRTVPEAITQLTNLTNAYTSIIARGKSLLAPTSGS